MTDNERDGISRRQTLATILAAGMVPALAQRAAAAGDFVAFNAGYAAKVVLPAMAGLADATAGLSKAAAAFATAPDAAGIEGLRLEFGAVSDAWARAQQFRLGPLDENHRAERFSYWPERRNIIEKQLAALLAGKDPAELDAARLAEGSVAVQGLPALERLLFGDDAAARLLAGEDAARRRAVVAAIAANLGAIAGETRSEWNGKASEAAPFSASPAEAASRHYSNLLMALEIISEHKIGAPLGTEAAKTKQKVAEQWRSHRSLRNILGNLEAARLSFDGDGGFASLLGASDPLRAQVGGAFSDALAACRGGDDDLAVLVTDPARRKEVTLLLVRVNHLRDLMRQKVASALGVTIGFNELDGDGA